MHILYLHQYYCPPGGWGNDRSADFARRWAAAGHQVTVATTTAYFPPDHPAQQQAYTAWHDGAVAVLTWRVPYAQRMGVWARIGAFLTFWWRLITLRNRGFDVIYASTTPPTVAVAGAILAARWRRPWVLEVVDVWPDVPAGMGLVRSRPLIALMQAVMRVCYRSARCVVTLSPGMKSQIMAQGIAAEHIVVVENGTDVAQFRPSAEPAAHAPSEPVRLIYAGAMGRANDLTQLLEAAVQLRDLSQPWQLDLYGQGAEYDALQARIQALELPQLRLHPPVPKQQLHEVFAASHVGVVCFAPYPVLEANAANKFFDYLAAGLPVVINYGGWQAQVLAESGCGLSSAQGDSTALAENLRRLIVDPALRAQMGAAARQIAVARYDRAVLSQQVLDLMRATLP